MSTQPEALRLADALERDIYRVVGEKPTQDAAAELRRLALKQWVGLTVNEARDFYEKYTDKEALIYAVDKFLEEKNNG